MAQITKPEFVAWVAKVLHADMAECTVVDDHTIMVTPIDPINGAPTFRLIVTAADEPHLIQFRESGFTIQHPLSCRPNLFACPVNTVARLDLAAPPALGVFEVALNEAGDQLLIGDRVGGEG